MPVRPIEVGDKVYLTHTNARGYVVSKGMGTYKLLLTSHDMGYTASEGEIKEVIPRPDEMKFVRAKTGSTPWRYMWAREADVDIASNNYVLEAGKSYDFTECEEVRV